MRELKPYEVEVIEAVSSDCTGLERKSDNEYRCACPAHQGDGANMAVYLNPTGVRFQCYSSGCSHDEIRDALGLKDTDLLPSRTNNLTLQDYSDAKRLSNRFLIDLGLSTGIRGEAKCVDIPYWDISGKKCLATRQRVLEFGKQIVKAKQGSKAHLYGLWRLSEAAENGYLVIVEGESDCHTLWDHGFSAVGVPGANCVHAIQPELDPFLQANPELKVYVFQEPGDAGQGFVDTFGEMDYRDRIQVVRLDGYKDPSELHISKPHEFNTIWQAAVTLAKPLSASVSSEARSFAELSPKINRKLNSKAYRADKQEIAKLIGNMLVSQKRLLKDISNADDPTPYAITDDGSAVPLQKGSKLLRYSLQDSGMNPSEPIFNWTIESLQHRAVREGKEVELKRYSFFRDGKLYVSAGVQRMVVAEPVDGKPFLHVEPNGYEGVLFAADGCFAPWELSKPLALDQLAAFRPCLEPPHEVPEYGALAQAVLLRSWLRGRIADVTMPILTSIGSMGSGKSITLRAIVKLFSGAGADVSGASRDQKDFDTAVITLPIHVIDNLDGEAENWLQDDLATTCTGGNKTKRQLFTDGTLISRPITAKLAVSTRTAAFASRSDITDRVLPLFYGALPDPVKVDDADLLEAVVENRNGLLTGLVEDTLRCLSHPSATGLSGRFQGFNNLVITDAEGNRATRDAWSRAQRLSVSDLDPLARAIIDHYSIDNRWVAHELEGTPTEIVAHLRNVDQALPNFGAGKAIARRLRELKSTLSLAGLILREEEGHNTTKFRILKSK